MQISKKKQQTLTLAQVDEEFQQVFTDADAQRNLGIERLLEVQEAKKVSLGRERVRLEVEGRGMARVESIDKRLEGREHMRERLEVEKKRLEFSTLEEEPGAWVIYGMVLGPKKEGVRGMSVELHTRRDGRKDAIASAKSQRDGSFYLSVSAPARSRSKKAKEEGESKFTATKLYVHVKDDGEALYVHPEPLNPKIGARQYLELFVPRTGASSGRSSKKSNAKKSSRKRSSKK